MSDDPSKTQDAVRIPELPSDRRIALAVTAIDQLARVTRPKFYGLENIPDKRVFFVGNHTIYGVLDVGFMLAELWKTHGFATRSLGDFKHWTIPVWSQFTTATGGVPGSPEVAAELMRRGEPLLVFPGGAREANKRRGEKYKLIWKQRLGFARLAIEHDYPIIPFAGVGAEEMLDVVVDDKNPIHRAASRSVERVIGMPVPSIVRGIGPTPIPRPRRLYFWFGEPIDSGSFSGDAAGARALRDTVKREVEGGIDFLLSERAAQRRSRRRRVAGLPRPSLLLR
jgi:1-acyl-sn-glycerol-3-phosphate acyltransferase